MSQQIHISSLIVHARPQSLPALLPVLTAMAGMEIHAADPSGKLVLVIEAESERQIAAALDHIQTLPGVLAANMVYHHAESADEIAKEIAHDADPT